MLQGDTKADFVEEAKRILEEAQKGNITLRLLGAVAYSMRCPKFGHLLGLLKREFTDLDFMGYGRQREAVVSLFKGLGYEFAPGTTRTLVEGRFFFVDEARKRVADVFFDKLDMSHTLDFRNRLEIDDLTLSLGDLLLEKLQIVKINEKDLKDVLVLLREYDVGSGDKGSINSEYISKLLSNDWGFYYTATMNLRKVKDFASKFNAVTDQNRFKVEERVDKLLHAIEERPKSLKWKMRGKIGTRKKWYSEVEEVERT